MMKNFECGFEKFKYFLYLIQAFHVEPTSPIETEELQSYTHVTDEINKILYADDTTDVEDKMADALHIKENSGTYVVRRHLAADAKSNSTDSLDGKTSYIFSFLIHFSSRFFSFSVLLFVFFFFLRRRTRISFTYRKFRIDVK